MIEQIINLIYPPKCGICGKINPEYLCTKCNLKLKKEAIWKIDQNQDTQNNYNERISIFPYKGIIRDLLLKYKFKEKSYLYKTIVNFLIKNEKIIAKIQNYDTMIPVPISNKRKKQRGYNQSLLIAKELTKNTNLKLDKNSLYKKIDTKEQNKLNKEQRKTNIQNAYELKNEQILKNKKILLLDDIYTTGSTVNSCCKTLKQAKPKEIGIFVICEDQI